MADEPEDEPYDGPDPRSWPGDNSIWPLVTDIRTIDEVLETLNGKAARDIRDPAFDEARQFLRTQAAERCSALSVAILRLYRIPVPGDEPADPPDGSV